MLVALGNNMSWGKTYISQSWCTDDQGVPVEGSVDADGYPLGECMYNTVKV